MHVVYRLTVVVPCVLFWIGAVLWAIVGGTVVLPASGSKRTPLYSVYTTEHVIQMFVVAFQGLFAVILNGIQRYDSQQGDTVSSMVESTKAVCVWAIFNSFMLSSLPCFPTFAIPTSCYIFFSVLVQKLHQLRFVGTKW